MKRLAYLYTVFAAAVCIWLATAIAGGQWLQTDLTALLPQAQQDEVLLAADKAGEAQINRQVIALIGHADSDTAFQTASELAQLWQKSGTFQQVDKRVSPDLEQMRRDSRFLGLAILPEAERQQLFNQPEAYFQARAEAAVNPFSAAILPLEQDWLGFGSFVADKSNPSSRLQWHTDSGMLFSEDEQGKTWVFIRGLLPEQSPNDKLLPLLQQSRELAAAQHAELLSAGGALFAAKARAEAEQESTLMSAAGVILTFGLLLWVFRSMRVFWLLLPLSTGLLLGLAASLWLFGQIHIMTLVIGTSLIGMLVDFPLHWLAPSVFPNSRWQADAEMKSVLRSFIVSLLITALGYALLWFTPLTVLRQTAVFSAFALTGAFAATVLWLPPLLRRHHGRPTAFAAYAEKLHDLSTRTRQPFLRIAAIIAALIFLAVGIGRSNWQDDIRQWIHMPSEMLAQVQQISVLSGMDFSGQYLVVEADDEDTLLQRNAQAEQALQPLISQGKLAAVQSLNQFIAPVAEQKTLQQYLLALAQNPTSWQAMRQIGAPDEALKSALQEAGKQQTVTLSDGLKTLPAQAWQPLYLGEVSQGRFASIIRLGGMNDAAAVQQAVAPLEGVHWADKRAHLNHLFQETRNQAAWLKLASYALALLALWRLFGLRGGLAVLAVPLLSAAAAVALLGWLQLPVSLFAMFGLLLVSAIGVDYAVYARLAPHGATVRLAGMLLAALTSGISFILLSASSTPAVAVFGLTVSFGVICNLFLAALMLKKPAKTVSHF